MKLSNMGKNMGCLLRKKSSAKQRKHPAKLLCLILSLTLAGLTILTDSSMGTVKAEIGDIMVITSNGESETGNSGDMAGLLDEVTIMDQNGEEIKDGKLFVGEKYSIHLKFQEKGVQSGDEGQFSWTDDRQMTYQIPKNFKVTPRTDVPLKVTIDGVEVEIGKFSVDENGLLTVQLTEEGKQKLTNSNNIGLSFDMEATAQITKGGSDEDVHFGDSGKDFGFKVTDQPQITVNKVSNYDSKQHILNYTVSMEVDHGPVHNVVVEDVLTPPNSNGITLRMVNGEDGKPDIKVTIISNGETLELAEEDYELVLVKDDPAYTGKQVFQIKLREGSPYEPLKTGDELQVAYQYQAEFDTSAADVYWGQVTNDATVTGSMPMEDLESGEKKEIPITETRHSYAEVYWDTDGKGVVSKDETYSEATGMLHYTLYAAAAAGEYAPFYITDRATVVYNGRTWIVDTSYIHTLKVYAQDVENWDNVDEHGVPMPGTGGKKELTGYTSGNLEGYSYSDMDKYISMTSDNSTDLFIFFGMNNTYTQGHWKYGKDRLMTVEYDLDVSNGLTLHDENTGESLTLTKEQVLLAGITNTVHLRYGHFYPGYSVFFSNGEKLNKYGKLDKVHNTIDYTVSLNLADTTVWDYLKDVNKGITSAIFYDDYDNGWNYVDGSLKATLYLEYQGAMEYIYNPKGLAEWQGIDDFNDGDIKAYLYNFEHKEYGWALPYAFVENYDLARNRLEFTYTLKASDEWLKANAYSEYDTNVHNTAEIKDNTMTHWAAEANVPYFPNRLTKTAQQDGTSNLITFTLEINSVGADLDPAKDYLIVTDESTGIQIKPGSIKVTDKDGNELKGIGDTTVDAELKPDQWGLLPTENEHQYKLKIPDGKVLHITYEALVTEMGDNVKVSNKASIDGVARTDSSYEESLKVDKVHASGEGSTHQLMIVKTDIGNSSKKLAGAKFRFYIVREESSGLAETKQITVGGREYSCYSEDDWEFTTDDNGQYLITGWKLEPGNYYILEELTPPDGYELAGPILLYYGLNDAAITIDSAAEIVPPDGMLTVGDPPIQYTLPETGGIGTSVFLAAGLAFLFAGGAVLTIRKRLHQTR